MAHPFDQRNEGAPASQKEEPKNDPDLLYRQIVIPPDFSLTGIDQRYLPHTNTVWIIKPESRRRRFRHNVNYSFPKSHFRQVGEK